MINIKETFTKLTSKLYPYRTEGDVIRLLPEFSFNMDSIGNYFIIVKKQNGEYSDTMFTCHLDTVDRGSTYYGAIDYSNRVWNRETFRYDIIDPSKEKDTVKKNQIVHVFDGDFIKTDGKTNLGADDKAGMVIMLNMITEKVPGLYYFFIGEESGCVGSSALSIKFLDNINKLGIPSIKKCISFDRKGYDSIITHQMSRNCASDKFSDELANRLNEYGFWFKKDSGGVYTDSAEFIDVIPECTNISCGYFNEHTLAEKQDIEFLKLLAIVCTQIDWETLPIERDCTGKSRSRYESSYNRYNTGNYFGNNGSYRRTYYNDDHDDYTFAGNSYGKKKEEHVEEKVEKEVIKTDFNTEESDTFSFDAWYKEQKEKSEYPF